MKLRKHFITKTMAILTATIFCFVTLTSDVAAQERFVATQNLAVPITAPDLAEELKIGVQADSHLAFLKHTRSGRAERIIQRGGYGLVLSIALLIAYLYIVEFSIWAVPIVEAWGLWSLAGMMGISMMAMFLGNLIYQMFMIVNGKIIKFQFARMFSQSLMSLYFVPAEHYAVVGHVFPGIANFFGSFQLVQMLSEGVLAYGIPISVPQVMTTIFAALFIGPPILDLIYFFVINTVGERFSYQKTLKKMRGGILGLVYLAVAVWFFPTLAALSFSAQGFLVASSVTLTSTSLVWNIATSSLSMFQKKRKKPTPNLHRWNPFHWSVFLARSSWSGRYVLTLMYGLVTLFLVFFSFEAFESKWLSVAFIPISIAIYWKWHNHMARFFSRLHEQYRAFVIWETGERPMEESAAVRVFEYTSLFEKIAGKKPQVDAWDTFEYGTKNVNGTLTRLEHLRGTVAILDDVLDGIDRSPGYQLTEHHVAPLSARDKELLRATTLIHETEQFVQKGRRGEEEGVAREIMEKMLDQMGHSEEDRQVIFRILSLFSFLSERGRPQTRWPIIEELSPREARLLLHMAALLYFVDISASGNRFMTDTEHLQTLEAVDTKMQTLGSTFKSPLLGGKVKHKEPRENRFRKYRFEIFLASLYVIYVMGLLYLIGDSANASPVEMILGMLAIHAPAGALGNYLGQRVEHKMENQVPRAKPSRVIGLTILMFFYLVPVVYIYHGWLLQYPGDWIDKGLYFIGVDAWPLLALAIKAFIQGIIIDKFFVAPLFIDIAYFFMANIFVERRTIKEAVAFMRKHLFDFAGLAFLIWGPLNFLAMMTAAYPAFQNTILAIGNIFWLVTVSVVIHSGSISFVDRVRDWLKNRKIYQVARAIVNSNYIVWHAIGVVLLVTALAGGRFSFKYFNGFHFTTAAIPLFIALVGLVALWQRDWVGENFEKVRKKYDQEMKDLDAGAKKAQVWIRKRFNRHPSLDEPFYLAA